MNSKYVMHVRFILLKSNFDIIALNTILFLAISAFEKCVLFDKRTKISKNIFFTLSTKLLAQLTVPKKYKEIKFQ